MSFFDLIRDLRTGTPDISRAARAMKLLGWACFFAGVWNYIVPALMPFDKSPFNLPPEYLVLALGSLLFLGALFLIAARGIANQDPWGRRSGQAAVVLLLGAIFGLIALFVSATNFPFSAFPRPILVVFSMIFMGQLVVPAWFGVRYLGRLPVRADGAAEPARRPLPGGQPASTGPARLPGTEGERYKDAPVPFGVAGTFFAMIAVPMITVMIAYKIEGPAIAGAFFLPVFILVFFGPILYNRVASPFEQERPLVASCTGGGSTFLLNASWPFFRLLVYNDGVEIRVIFHRFFIPYDKMEELPAKLGFFSMGIPFRSDLPGVPSSIRFYGFGSKDVLALIREQRVKFLTKRPAG